MRNFVIQLPILLLLLPCITGNAPRGKLSKEENIALAKTCGQHIRARHDFVDISPRHIIVDVTMSFLRRRFDVEKCKNNIFNIQNDFDETGNDATETRAWYIGSCDVERPQGFILLEHVMDQVREGSPWCMPKSPLKMGDTVELLLRDRILSTSDFRTEVSFCQNLITHDFCAKEYISGMAGPLGDANDARRTFVGYAYNIEDRDTRIISIHQYKEQICEVSGICDVPESELDNDVTAPKIVEAVTETTRKPAPTKRAKPVMRNLRDEPLANEPFPSSKSVLSPPLPTASLEKVPPTQIIHPEATVARAEPGPVAAVVIPLPDTSTPGKKTQQFPSSPELVIGGLILVALIFFVFLCLNGCVDRKVIPRFWRSNTDETTV